MAGALPVGPDACGIDFGTSNSTAGCGSDTETGRAVLLDLEDGKPTIPSVVFSMPRTGTSVTAGRRWPITWPVTRGA